MTQSMGYCTIYSGQIMSNHGARLVLYWCILWVVVCWPQLVKENGGRLACPFDPALWLMQKKCTANVV